MLPTSVEQYLALDIRDFDRDLNAVSPAAWQRTGDQVALRVFHEAARRIPAYADYLRKHDVDPARIVSPRDFREHVPPLDKASYIDQYPLEDMVWDGRLSAASLVNTSSGTAGRSYFWPTGQDEVAASGVWYEYLFDTLFHIGKGPTLFVICFGMGTWIAGSYTYNATRFFDRKGYPFTTITPGFDRDHAAAVLSSVGDKFDQVVIAGIPSFIRDLVRDVTLPPGRTRVLLAGEGFTEAWRDFVLARIGSSCPSHVASLYGSADAGLMGFETVASIRARRAFGADETLRQRLLGGRRVPMLFQFSPASRFYETHGGELLVTADRALPLVRYNLHDEGAVLSADRLGQALESMEKDGGAAPGNGRDPCRMPFVAVYGRGRFSTTLYGANIYAEEVQDLFQDPAVALSFTGRFSMQTSYDSEQMQRLELHAELAPDVQESPGLAEGLTNAFVERVTRSSTEYRKIVSEYGQKAHPRVTLHVAGRGTMFATDRQVKTS